MSRCLRFKSDPGTGDVWVCRRDAGHDGPCAAEPVGGRGTRCDAQSGMDQCRHEMGHAGAHSMHTPPPSPYSLRCPAVHPAIDTYPDGAAQCELMTGHDGAHRMEWA